MADSDPGGDCACHTTGPSKPIDVRYLGTDRTSGRYANVAIRRCRDCGKAWLHYAVEYEAFTGSGRWCQGLIEESQIAGMTPEAAAAYLANLDWHIYGGSYFGHAGRRGSGKLHWGI